jgi:hypothetical protein
LQKRRAYKLVNEIVKPGFKYYSICLTSALLMSFLCFLINCLIDNSFFVSNLAFAIQILIIIMISEVYGFQYGRQALWIITLSQLLIYAVSAVTSDLDNSTIMPVEVSNFYSNIINISLSLISLPNLFEFIAIFYGMQMLSISKKYFAGKMPILRIMFSAIFVNIIFSVMMFLFYIYLHYNLKTAFEMVAINFCKYIFLFFLLSGIFSYIAKKLINMEEIYIYDRKEKYRVFGFIPETANLYLVSSKE